MTARQPRAVVLVVDDHDLIRGTFREILEQDFDVLEAPDGQSALEIARMAPIDVVLLDLLMPGIDSFTVLARLLVMRPEVRVVVVSGVDSAAAAATALRSGAVDYLTKPVENEALLSGVHRALHEPSVRPAVGGEKGGSSLAIIGSPASIIAAIAAALEPHVAVRSFRDLAPAVEVAGHGMPALIVFDARARALGWLD